MITSADSAEIPCFPKASLTRHMQAVSVSSEMGDFALLGGESTALVPLEVTQGCLSEV